MPKRKQREDKLEAAPNAHAGDGDPGHKPDPIVRALALSGNLVAAAVGPHIRLLDSK